MRSRAVAVLLPNRADLVATLFGAWRAGAVYVPLNPRLTPTELDTPSEELFLGGRLGVDLMARTAPV